MEMASSASGEWQPPPPSVGYGGRNEHFAAGLLGIIAGSLNLLGIICPGLSGSYYYSNVLFGSGFSYFILGCVFGLGAIISSSLLLCGRSPRRSVSATAGFTSCGGFFGILWILQLSTYYGDFSAGFYITILAMLVEAAACITAIVHLKSLQKGSHVSLDESDAPIVVKATP